MLMRRISRVLLPLLSCNGRNITFQAQSGRIRPSDVHHSRNQVCVRRPYLSSGYENTEFRRNLETAIITRRAGRPRNKRIRSRGEVPAEEYVICGNCLQKGHNRRTCSTQPMRNESSSSSRNDSRPAASDAPSTYVSSTIEPPQIQSSISSPTGTLPAASDVPTIVTPHIQTPSSSPYASPYPIPDAPQAIEPFLRGEPPRKRRTVTCVNCGGSYYRKTPCRSATSA